MFVLVLLLSLVIVFPFLLKGVFFKLSLRWRDKYEGLNAQNSRLTLRAQGLKESNLLLRDIEEEKVALYDITKDICKSLDEEAVFNVFRSRIDKFIRIKKCILLKNEEELLPYKDFNITPLLINENPIGYLAVDKIRIEDEEKFHILTQQLLLGLKRANLFKKVQDLAITDSLTQVFSRRHFMERFAEELERSRKFKLKLSFLMIDIDHFKEFNDHYGHLVGDGIIKEACRIIKASIRQVDFMGRYGGEELSIVLAETDSERASLAAERIRQALESQEIKVYDEKLKITISIGIATFPEDADTTALILERADEALYKAKEGGRNKVVAYHAGR